MNSYHIGLAGSWWFLILLILLSAGLTFWTYRRTVPEIPLRRKAILIALRFLALFLFCFVLFEPVFTLIRGSFEKPKLAVLLDNSLSMAMTDSKGDRKTDYMASVKNSGFLSLNESERKIAAFDNDVKEFPKFSFDSLKLKGQPTDISKAFKRVNSNLETDNTGAVLLITDGAYNAGNNPLYESDQTGKKVYVIGIGDTTEPRDASIQSIITNDVAYIDNPVPVNINLKISGYKSCEVKVKLSDNGSQIAEQSISISPDKQVYSLLFQYNPKNEGIRKLTASVTSLEGELTQKNNSLSEFVNVLKNKRKIVIFSGSPNPDLTFIRGCLEGEKGVEVKTFIQKQGAEFFEGNPTAAQLHDAEMLVLIGFPISSSSQSSIELIKAELDKGKPVLLIASQFLDYSKLKTLEEYLPFNTLTSKPQEFLALGDFRKEASANPILKITGAASDIDQWNQLPPVFRTETFVKVKPESEILAGLKVNNTSIKEPLLMTRNFQNKKSVAVLGYGLYRWRLLGYAADVAKGRNNVVDLYSSFVLNSHRWLSVNQDYKNVIIKTSKKVYSLSERVEFIAQIYDASYTPVENCNVSIKVSGGNQGRDLILNSIGNGRYTGFIDGLGEGDYYFTGEARQNGTFFGKDNGRFSIGDISIEYLDLKMNIGLLTTIAQRSGGKFYTVANANEFMNDLSNDPNFKQKAMTLRNEFSLWNLPWILGLAILCLSLEWFLRKRSGMI